jgi:hypothetical protein
LAAWPKESELLFWDMPGRLGHRRTGICDEALKLESTPRTPVVCLRQHVIECGLALGSSDSQFLVTGPMLNLSFNADS